MLIRLATEPARPGRTNEDFIAATPEVLVLLDGAGSPPGIETGCTHSVAWYVRRLGPALLAEAHLDQPLTDALAAAIAKVAVLHSGSCDLSNSGGPSATVLAVRRRDTMIEYLVLADSTLVLQADSRIITVTDNRESIVGRTHRAAMDATPNGTSEHDAALASYMREMRARRNVVGGFWVAASDPAAAPEALTGSLREDQVSLLALLSDGATRLVDRFGLATWQELTTMLAEPFGHSQLIDRTRAAEASDPLGFRWPRGKATDDASVIVAVKAPTQA